MTLPADATAPVVALGSTSHYTTAANVRVPWTVTEHGSGIDALEVQTRRTTFSGSWSTWATTKLAATARYMTLPVARGYEHCYRLRARDEADNWSTWSPVGCTAGFRDDTSLRAGSGWRTQRSSSFWAGTAESSTRNRSVLNAGRVSAQQVTLLATRCPGCGTVEIRIGTKMVGRVNLNATIGRHRQQITLPMFAARSGALTLTVASNGRNVLIDGVSVSR